MYQDLIKNHRLTEIDYINGAVWRKGQKYNVATPFCAMLTQLVHGKEELLELNNSARDNRCMTIASGIFLFCLCSQF